jgi:hypothetical protein
MLKNIAIKLNLVFTKENKYRVLFLLGINQIFKLKLNMTKRLRGIKKPIIHYYSLCWNEEQIIPHVLDYYNEVIDNFYVLDNMSTDNSVAILKENKKVSVYRFDTSGEMNDDIQVNIKNNVWKKSRGKADFVIVSDMDEFLYHPELNEYFEYCYRNKFSFFNPIGYDMFSNVFPEFNQSKSIITEIKTGVKSLKYSKSIVFDPHRIVEVNYTPGAHYSTPYGIVNYPEENEFKLLHYRNLGLGFIIKRLELYRKRQSELNLSKGYNGEYFRKENEIIQDFNQNLEKSKIVI